MADAPDNAADPRGDPDRAGPPERQATSLYAHERAGPSPARLDTVPATGSRLSPTSDADRSRPDRRQSTDSAAEGHLVIDRDRELERKEHLATLARMRRLMPLAVVLWSGFIFVDWVLTTWVVPGDLWPYLWLRLLGTLPIVGSWWRLRRAPAPGPRLLAGLDLWMTTSCATILAVMCLLSGGLTSPYVTYIAMVLVGRGASMPNHWRVGMVRLGVPALASPVVLGLALPWSEHVQGQLADPGARGFYFFYLMLLAGAWGLVVITGHNQWALRRQVFRSRSIGRYRLDRRIGEGGMGEIWVAWDEQLRRDVALKLLHPDRGHEAEATARFEREILATARLTHPNTVRIFDHGVTEDGLWYYAMELLEGIDLGEVVARDGPLPPLRALHIARQAAGALAEAHRSGIVHRDLKPENLFVVEIAGEPDFIKVLDFGIARLLRDDAPRLTGTGWITGTPAYLSPEAAAGGDVGPPADVYGLGGLLYFTLTGALPFDARNAVQMLQLHVSAPPVPPSQRLGRALPPSLEAIIMRCLAKAPTDRYEHAAQLAIALDECVAKIRAEAAPSSGGSVAPG